MESPAFRQLRSPGSGAGHDRILPGCGDGSLDFCELHSGVSFQSTGLDGVSPFY